MGRWDRFHEAQMKTGEQWIADEIVKQLTKDLASWPPPVEAWLDERTRERFEPALSPFCPRPPVVVYRAAFKLARWELERAFDALDEWGRNDRSGELTTDTREKLCLLFLQRWLTDSMLELLEVSPLKRPKLVECLSRIEARLLDP